MADVASIVLVGRVVRAPECKDVGGSNRSYRLASFSVAVNARVRGDDVASFFDCEAWEKNAEVVERYCDRGKLVAVVGTIRIDKWEKDGVKRSKPIVKVDKIALLGGAGEGAAASNLPAPVSPNPAPSEDVPF